MIQTIRTSTHAEFWPSGWLVYASVALGMFDVAMVANLVRMVAR